MDTLAQYASDNEEDSANEIKKSFIEKKTEKTDLKHVENNTKPIIHNIKDNILSSNEQINQQHILSIIEKGRKKLQDATEIVGIDTIVEPHKNNTNTFLQRFRELRRADDELQKNVKNTVEVDKDDQTVVVIEDIAKPMVDIKTANIDTSATQIGRTTLPANIQLDKRTRAELASIYNEQENPAYNQIPISSTSNNTTARIVDISASDLQELTPEEKQLQELEEVAKSMAGPKRTQDSTRMWDAKNGKDIDAKEGKSSGIRHRSFHITQMAKQAISTRHKITMQKLTQMSGLQYNSSSGFKKSRKDTW